MLLIEYKLLFIANKQLSLTKPDCLHYNMSVMFFVSFTSSSLLLSLLHLSHFSPQY